MTTTSLFNFPSTPKSGSGAPKLKVAHGSLPPYIDPLQPPFKKAPWRQIKETTFAHSVTLSVPQDLGNLLRDKLLMRIQSRSRYAKVIMSLGEVLNDDFFTEYIKKGNILMLSKPNTTLSNDPFMSIASGVLTIDMPSHIYQRSGLINATTVLSGGQKHKQSRFRAQYDLRSTSMLHGKKAFDRLVRAGKEVQGLNEPRTWCFADLSKDQSDQKTDTNKDGHDVWHGRPIMKFHPTIVSIEATTRSLQNVKVPSIIRQPAHLRNEPITNEIRTEEDIYDMVEWLDMVKLGSSRITADDNTDPFICTYRAPCNDEDPAQITNLVNFTWKGLLSVEFLVNLLIEVIRISRAGGSKDWACLSVNAYRTEAVGYVDGYSIFLSPKDAQLEIEHQAEGIGDQDAMQIDEKDETSKQGLQYFMCFQHVDSLIS